MRLWNTLFVSHYKYLDILLYSYNLFTFLSCAGGKGRYGFNSYNLLTFTILSFNLAANLISNSNNNINNYNNNNNENDLGSVSSNSQVRSNSDLECSNFWYKFASYYSNSQKLFFWFYLIEDRFTYEIGYRCELKSNVYGYGHCSTSRPTGGGSNRKGTISKFIPIEWVTYIDFEKSFSRWPIEVFASSKNHPWQTIQCSPKFVLPRYQWRDGWRKKDFC